KGLYTDQEAAGWIHAGAMETSLVLHFLPDLVKMDKADNFGASTIRISNELDFLRPTGQTGLARIAPDLLPSGAAGDAERATAEKGKATAEYRAAQFIKLLHDVTRFSMDRLA